MSNTLATPTKKEEKSHLEDFPLFFEHTHDNRKIIQNGKVVKYPHQRKLR